MGEWWVVLDGQLKKAVTGDGEEKHCYFWEREHPYMFSSSFHNYRGKNHEWVRNLAGKF